MKFMHLLLLWILNFLASSNCIITLKDEIVSIEKVKAMYEYGHRHRTNLNFSEISKSEFKKVYEWLWTNLTQEQLYQLKLRVFPDGSKLEDLVEEDQWSGFLQESWQYDPIIYHYINLIDLSVMTREQFEVYGQEIYNLSMEASCGLFKNVVMASSKESLKKKSLLPVSDWFLLSLSPIKLYECRLAGLLAYGTEERIFLQLLGFMSDSFNDPMPRIAKLLQPVREAWHDKQEISYILADNLINDPVGLKTGYLKYRLQQFGQGMVNLIDGKSGFEWNLSLLAKDELLNIQSDDVILNIGNIKLSDSEQGEEHKTLNQVQKNADNSEISKIHIKNDAITADKIKQNHQQNFLQRLNRESNKPYRSRNFLLQMMQSFLKNLGIGSISRAAILVLLGILTVYCKSPRILLDNNSSEL